MKILADIFRYIRDDWSYRYPASLMRYRRGFMMRGALTWLYIFKTLIALLLIIPFLVFFMFYYLFFGIYLILKIFYDKPRYENDEEYYDDDYEYDDCYED